MSSSQDTKSNISSSTLSSKEKDETQKPQSRDSSGENDDSNQANAGSKDQTRKHSLSENFKSLFGSKRKISPLNPPSPDSSHPSQHSNPRSSLGRANESAHRVSSRRFGFGSRNQIAPEELDESRRENEPEASRTTLRRRSHLQSSENLQFSSTRARIFRVVLGIVGCNRQRYSDVDLKEFYKCVQFFCDGFTTWWILFNIFFVSVTFTSVQPRLNEYRREFVEREYHDFNKTTCLPSTDILPLCLTPNETSLLNGEHINRFVRTLHSIITEDCHLNLDRHNIAIDFEEDRPLINEDTIFDGLLRNFNYTIDEARLLIKTCRVVFNRTYHDVVAVHDHEFIYLNDSLMKYCNFKTDFVSDIYVFLVLFVLFHFIVILPLRCVVSNAPDDLRTWYIENWIKN